MRYELRLTAYDAMDLTYIKMDCDAVGPAPEYVTGRVVARTGIARTSGSLEATEWIREVLETMLAAL